MLLLAPVSATVTKLTSPIVLPVMRITCVLALGWVEIDLHNPPALGRERGERAMPHSVRDRCLFCKRLALTVVRHLLGKAYIISRTREQTRLSSWLL